jgi:catechol 2,3-dioxygenase-like lactoylglutathione lyase family enzyme
MLRIIEPIVLFVSNIERATDYYRVMLGEEPESRHQENLVSFSVGGQANITLLQSDSPLTRHSAALLCDDLDTKVTEWRQWVGMINLECLDSRWPLRFVVLQDLDCNTLVVLEANSNQSCVVSSLFKVRETASPIP